MAIEDVRAALLQHGPELLGRAHVVATGVGFKKTAGETSDRLCVVCSVSRKLPRANLSPSQLVPESLSGIPTDVVETGVIRALATRTERQRPAPGGVSIGHVAITAGTLGCVVRKNGQRFLLSNNHVLANSNEATPGDPILQPGPHDGGRFPEDQLATLAEFVPIQFPGGPSECPVGQASAATLNALASALGRQTRLVAVQAGPFENLVDAALAKPVRDAELSDDIVEIGKLQGVVEGALGMALQKSGRTTGLTQGRIEQVDVTVNVQYGAGQIATFRDQLLAGPMSQGGDSGSAVLDDRRRLVGLLFAGSDSTTILNRIQNVFTALGVGL